MRERERERQVALFPTPLPLLSLPSPHPAGIELTLMALNYKKVGYVRKRLLLGKLSGFNTPLHPPYTLHPGVPAQIAFAALLSYAAFDWKPGTWTPLMMTLSFWLSMIAHYPMEAKKVPFLQHMRSTLVIALIVHLGVFIFIFAIVIPTRLLVRSTPSPTPLNRQLVDSLDRAGGERQAGPHAAHDGSRVSVPGLPHPQSLG